MALTRKLLKGMGLTDEQVDTIIEAHTDTVDGLKEDISKYKSDADKLSDVQKELNELKANNKDDWKEKHDKIKGEYDAFKKEIEAKNIQSLKEKAYRDILKEANLSEKGIEKAMKYADWEKMSLEADGKLTNAAEHIKSAKEEWAEYVVSTNTTGTKTTTPPTNINGTGGTGKTREEILAIKDGFARRAEMAKNPQLFGLEKND